MSAGQLSREPKVAWKRELWRSLAPLGLFAAIGWVVPRPAEITAEGWRLLGIFAGAVTGLVLEPIPGGAVVLLAVALSAIWGGLTVEQALSGYANPSVWLVMAAFFISRALIKTGVARRIALGFVRLFGKTSLGVCYALSLSDMVLASMIPSHAARSGGVILPIALPVYFYAHYGFASITAHILAMYAPFLAVLAAKGAPLGLVVYAFACFTSLAAGLTNYGTTPAPMFFAHGYVSLGRWWKVGAAVSVVNIAVWCTIGFWWWKLIGVW